MNPCKNCDQKEVRCVGRFGQKGEMLASCEACTLKKVKCWSAQLQEPPTIHRDGKSRAQSRARSRAPSKARSMAPAPDVLAAAQPTPLRVSSRSQSKSATPGDVPPWGRSTMSQAAPSKARARSVRPPPVGKSVFNMLLLLYSFF